MIFGKKKITTLDIDLWKMNNPLFNFRLSTEQLFKIQNDSIDKSEELGYLRELEFELTSLIMDPQVDALNLFPHYVRLLLVRRKHELDEIVKK